MKTEEGKFFAGLWKGEYRLRCQESNYSANLMH